jgi:hypothetical protein
MVFNQQMNLGPYTWRIVLVLSRAMRGGARNRTVTRNAAQEIEYDYAHEHEQPELPVTIGYFREF